MKQYHILYLFIVLSVLFSSCDKSEIELIDDQPEEQKPPIVDGPELFVAGYLPHYGINRFDLEAINHLDRIYYFSVAPDTLGNFEMEDLHSENIKTLKNKVKGTQTELFIVIGGWYESETIFAMAANESKRTAYADSLVQFCIENDLDGIDLDWESYPRAVPEADYVALVNVLSDKLHANNLLFTIAVAASHVQLSAKFKDKADQINIMSYGVLDDNGNQVPMSMLNTWLNKFDQAGIPRSKLIVGVPFYGKRPYNANDSSSRAVTYSYIVEKSSPAYDDNKYGQYSYNGRSLMHSKTKYLRENSYYGIMSWELSQDVEYNSRYSLLKSIIEVAK